MCGNFQPKAEHEDLYTANADITSVRAVLAEAACRKLGIKVLDVQTAFLNAKLPDSYVEVLVRPPQALVEFGVIEPGTIRRLQRAVYGLRISPKAWGLERDKEMRKMTVHINGKVHSFRQSHIDQSVWSIVEGPPTPQGVWQPSGDEPAIGWVMVYVDDFLVVGDDDTINSTTETLRSPRSRPCCMAPRARWSV